MSAPLESQNESGITIKHRFFRISIPKQDTYKAHELEIIIENHRDQEVQIISSVGEFKQNKDYLTNYLYKIDKYNDWFQPLDVTIDPQTTQTVTVTMQIPQSANLSDASYYPALILKVKDNPSETLPAVEIEQAIPVFVQLEDKTNAKVKIEKFDSEDFVIGSEIDIESEIKNVGNTYAQPTGYLEFYELPILPFVVDQDKTRLTTRSVNTKSSILLPESVLSEDYNWKMDSLGHYESTMYVMLGEEVVDEKTIDFWIIPWIWIVIAALLVLVLLASATLLIKRVRRKVFKTLGNLVKRIKKMLRFRKKEKKSSKKK